MRKRRLPSAPFAWFGAALLGCFASLLARLFALLACIVTRLDLLIGQWQPVDGWHRFGLFEEIIETNSATIKFIIFLGF